MKRYAAALALALTLGLVLFAASVVNRRPIDVIAPRIAASDFCRTEEGALKININKIDAETLCLLPGIGEVLSERIIDRREERGGFRTVQELIEIEGIGPSTLERLSACLYCE